MFSRIIQNSRRISIDMKRIILNILMLVVSTSIHLHSIELPEGFTEVKSTSPYKMVLTPYATYPVMVGEYEIIPQNAPGIIYSIAFSPTEKYFALASVDEIKIFEVDTWKLIKILKGYGHIVSVAFNNDGSLLVSGQEGLVRLYEIKTGKLIKELHMFKDHSSPVTDVDFSLDGKYLAASGIISSEDPMAVFNDCDSIKVWETNTGKLLQSLAGGMHNTYIKFSSDSKYLISAGEDTSSKLWDISTGKLLQEFENYTSGSIDISPDGKFLAVAVLKSIHLWDINKNKLLRKFEIIDKVVSSFLSYNFVLFHPNGKYIISGDSEGTIRFWNINTGKSSINEINNLKQISSLSFSPDGKRLVAREGLYDDTFEQTKLWDVETKKLINILDHKWIIAPIKFSLDGSYFLTAGNEVRIWEASTGKFITKLEQKAFPINSVDFNVNKNYFASGGDDNTIKIWETNTGSLLSTFKGHTDHVRSVKFSSKGNYLVSGSKDGTIKLWDVETNKLLRTFIGHKSYVWAVYFSSDDKYLVSGSYDHTVKIWETSTGKLLQTLNSHSWIVYSVDFSPNGRYIASGGYDKVINIWEINTCKLIRSITNTSSVDFIKFSPDDKYLASANGNEINLIEVSTGKLLRIFKGHSWNINSFDFSYDSKYLVSGSDDKTIKLWEVDTSKLLRTFKGHTDYVNSVNFSPNGKFIISGGRDTMIKMWDRETGNLLLTFYATKNDDWITYTPENFFNSSINGSQLIAFKINNRVALFKEYENILRKPDKIKELFKNK